MKTKKKIYRIKNLLIAVLFMSAILLLSFFWKDISLDKISSFTLNFQDNDEKKPEITELVKPEQVEICFGSGIYTVLNENWSLSEHGIKNTEIIAEETGNEENKDGIYSYLLILAADYFTQEDLTHEKIEKEQYDEVMSYPSISGNFNYNIPLNEFFEHNNISYKLDKNTTININKFLLSAADSKNLLVYDEENDTYYRFVTQDTKFSDQMHEKLSDLITKIEETGYTPYYTIETLAGIKNETLIPLNMDEAMFKISCSSEFSINDSYAVKRYEQIFFPSGLDFVRIITENKGSLIYNYGYNEKVLTLDESGCIRYTEENNASEYAEISFYEGLQEAVDYVSTHGGWSSSLMAQGQSVYLSRAEKITCENGKYQGYQYTFGIRVNGVPVMLTPNPMLQVEVYGTQITSYIRDVIKISGISSVESESTINAIDVITDKYEKIEEIMSKKESDAVEQESETTGAVNENTYEGNGFENVTKKIKVIKYCMMRNSENHPQQAIPAWYIQVDDTGIWCSTEDGQLLAWNSEVIA